MADHDLYAGFIRLHLLHHASKEPIFGLGMIRELHRHGYHISPGTLYPILLRLESAGWFVSRWENIDPSAVGRPRKRFYRLTASGLAQASAAFVGLNLGKGVPA